MKCEHLDVVLRAHAAVVVAERDDPRSLYAALGRWDCLFLALAQPLTHILLAQLVHLLSDVLSSKDASTLRCQPRYGVELPSLYSPLHNIGIGGTRVPGGSL